MESGFFEKMFKLRENHTNVKTEVLAGITTFMTMAYILVVNPDILSAAGMDRAAVFTATAASSAIATYIMGFLANYPFALAPGMGLNAFFAFTVVLGMGYSWQFALTAVLIEGLFFILLSFFKVREQIVNAIPLGLKNAVSAGIGLFIAFIGMVNIGMVTKSEPVIGIGNLRDPLILLTIFGLLITAVLLVRNVKGAFLIGMILTTGIGMILGIVAPPSAFISAPPSLSPIFGAFRQVDPAKIFSWDMIIVVFTFLFVDLFDTVGCLVGLSAKAGMLDKEGNLPRVSQALMADAVGTTFGAVLGTSTVTTYVESAAGISEGGRTGLTAVVTGTLFLISLLFAPIFIAIPSQATAPVLILVGVMMASSIVKIDFHDFTEAVPAFLTIVMMPFAYSIAEGIVFGIISYVVIKALAGKGKSVTPVLYILALLFIIKIVLAG
ncbi:MAG: NCS2 family permease [Peptostreptococcaceae bacterium]|nr:NCS2 family permease [Peptostreptococcaceae bacterium]